VSGDCARAGRHHESDPEQLAEIEVLAEEQQAGESGDGWVETEQDAVGLDANAAQGVELEGIGDRDAEDSDDRDDREVEEIGGVERGGEADREGEQCRDAD
jgi:hypothetical protein